MAENEIVPRLFGSYLLTEKLGADAIGKVYRARKIDDPAAFFRLRIFEAPRLDSEPVLISIEENGAVHDFLKNPAVARDVELDSVEGDAFFAHRDAGGRTLDALLEISRKRPFPIPIEHALLMAEKIATGLDHAYNTLIDGERTLHGLVWPGFVDISDEGETRLVGFGLAEGVMASRAVPAVQNLLFPYLAPEVRSSGLPTRTGDVYSTAAILVTMLTGEPPPLDRAQDAVAGWRLSGGGERLPDDIASVLRVALAESHDNRYETAGALRRELGKLLFSGKYAPSTFNFAFFLTNLLKEEIAAEQARRKDESGWDASQYPRPAVTARPPRLVAAPRFGLSVAAVEEPAEKKSPLLKIVGGMALGLAILAGSIYVLSIKGRPLMSQLPRKGTATSSAAPAAPTSSATTTSTSATTTARPAPAAAPTPTAVMTQAEFKNEVARRLGEEVKKLEAVQKTKQARAQADTRVASLKPVPAPVTPRLSAPKPIPTGGPAAPSATPSGAGARPTPTPLPVAPASPAAPAPTTRRGDLVASAELDRLPQIESVVKPEYPSIARRMNISGTVVLSVLVAETGKVEDIRVVRDPGRNVGLPQAAEKAVRQWTFIPAQKNGVAVKTWYTVPIPFVL